MYIMLIVQGIRPLCGVKQYFVAKCVNIAKTVGDTSKFTIYE